MGAAIGCSWNGSESYTQTKHHGDPPAVDFASLYFFIEEPQNTDHFPTRQPSLMAGAWKLFPANLRRG